MVEAGGQVCGSVWGAPGATALLSGVLYAVVCLLPVSSVWAAGEVSSMAKYKRWEAQVLQSLERRRPVRHSRKPFRGDRGARCEECGHALHSTHNFGLYGGWCVLCWSFFQRVEEVVIDGWRA